MGYNVRIEITKTDENGEQKTLKTLLLGMYAFAREAEAVLNLHTKYNELRCPISCRHCGKDLEE